MKKLYFIVILVILSGCYYDAEDELYPAGTCDTTNVSFSVDIEPIIKRVCLTCHMGSSASGGVKLENYTEIKNSTLSGNLIKSLTAEGGISQMPQGGKLADCEITKIKAWADKGAPNN